MRKTSLTILICIPVLLLLNFCNKRPFARVQISGKIINASNNLPVNDANISCWAGCDPAVACGEGNNFGEAKTNQDGTFTIKSKAQWNGNLYILQIFFFDSTTHSTHGERLKIHVSKNTKLDLGDIKL